MNKLLWLFNRLKAMSVQEILWRFNQKSIQIKEKKRFCNKYVSVCENIFNIKLK